MIKITEYFSPLCMPCKILWRKLEDLREKYKGEIQLEKVNLLMRPQEGIQGTPYIIVKKNDEVLMEKHVSDIMATLKELKGFIEE